MFRHFRSRFPAFAEVGVAQDDSFWASNFWTSNWFQHEHPGKHPHGKRHHEKHGGPFGRDRGDEPRNRRGDIKFILLELLSDQPRHGYELIKEMETRYGGFRRLSPGSVYPTLQMLEEGGYLTGEQTSGKRVYTITDAGRQLLAERTPQPGTNASPDALSNAPGEFMELRHTAMQLTAAVTQVARSGNLDRIRRVRDRLEQVKRDIYTILAEPEDFV